MTPFHPGRSPYLHWMQSELGLRGAPLLQLSLKPKVGMTHFKVHNVTVLSPINLSLQNSHLANVGISIVLVHRTLTHT